MQNYNKIVQIEDSICYLLDDKFHRIGGPAVEYFDGSKEWFENGKQHRIDGPAVEGNDGTKDWYYKGKYIDCNSQEEFERYVKLKLFW